eukprot:3438141-Amphidinium_carterae.1
MHEASLAEVLAEMEELEASSSSRFNKIDTSDFGVHALNLTMDGHTPPMQQQTASFPNSTGPRRDCGHVHGLQPPLDFHLGRVRPHSTRNQGQGYESFGEQTNNLRNPSKPTPRRRNGGDYPGPGGDDDDDDDDQDDDDGSGVYERRRPIQVIGWCDICKKKCLATQKCVWCRRD